MPAYSVPVTDPHDAVFKALADPTRRFLLDALRQQNGQTLGELCARLSMARQSVTQHLGLLEAANLVATVKHGREKLHYLNPVPLHEIQERWINRFERPRLEMLSAVRRRAESRVSDKPSFVYTSYIQSTPEQVWEALTDPEITAKYWWHRQESDWQAGSRWEHVRSTNGQVDCFGEVVESIPPRRLVLTWQDPQNADAWSSTVTFEIQKFQEAVKLTVTHVDLPDEAALRDVTGGWTMVISNLKSLLENGTVIDLSVMMP
ncbi:MarR family transcriptional regulator [Pseudonocardiaceae bacterium YIM PH 21723]|nr:MarR family transcriptional regulator [Pseudonocardiaceae bacterium YIM PH 21723]